MKKSVLILLFLMITFAYAEEIKVTNNHPFLVNDSWVEASELNVGDYLTSIDGKIIKITNIQDIQETKEVFNFETLFHNYIVFPFDIVVHNSNLKDKVSSNVVVEVNGNGYITSSSMAEIRKESKNAYETLKLLDEEFQENPELWTDYKNNLDLRNSLYELYYLLILKHASDYWNANSRTLTAYYDNPAAIAHTAFIISVERGEIEKYNSERGKSLASYLYNIAQLRVKEAPKFLKKELQGKLEIVKEKASMDDLALDEQTSIVEQVPCKENDARVNMELFSMFNRLISESIPLTPGMSDLEILNSYVKRKMLEFKFLGIEKREMKSSFGLQSKINKHIEELKIEAEKADQNTLDSNIVLRSLKYNPSYKVPWGMARDIIETAVSDLLDKQIFVLKNNNEVEVTPIGTAFKGKDGKVYQSKDVVLTYNAQTGKVFRIISTGEEVSLYGDAYWGMSSHKLYPKEVAQPMEQKGKYPRFEYFMDPKTGEVFKYLGPCFRNADSTEYYLKEEVSGTYQSGYYLTSTGEEVYTVKDAFQNPITKRILPKSEIKAKEGSFSKYFINSQNGEMMEKTPETYVDSNGKFYSKEDIEVVKMAKTRRYVNKENGHTLEYLGSIYKNEDGLYTINEIRVEETATHKRTFFVKATDKQAYTVTRAGYRDIVTGELVDGKELEVQAIKVRQRINEYFETKTGDKVEYLGLNLYEDRDGEYHLIDEVFKKSFQKNGVRTYKFFLKKLDENGNLREVTRIREGSFYAKTKFGVRTIIPRSQVTLTQTVYDPEEPTPIYQVKNLGIVAKPLNSAYQDAEGNLYSEDQVEAKYLYDELRTKYDEYVEECKTNMGSACTLE